METPAPLLILERTLSYGGSAAYSPDGNFLVAEKPIPGGIQVVLVEVASGVEAWAFQPEHVREGSRGIDGDFALAFSPDGTKIATGSFGYSVYLLDATTGEMISQTTLRDYDTPGSSAPPITVAFTPDGQQVLAGECEESPRLTVWDLKTNRTTHQAAAACEGMAISSRFPVAALASAGRGPSILDLDPLGDFGLCCPEYYGAFSVAFSPDGKILAAAVDGGLVFYDLERRTELTWAVDFGFQPLVWTIAWSQRNQLALLAWNEEESEWNLGLWDAESQRLVETVQVPEQKAGFVTFAPDGSHVITGGAGEMDLWKIETAEIP